MKLNIVTSLLAALTAIGSPLAANAQSSAPSSVEPIDSFAPSSADPGETNTPTAAESVTPTEPAPTPGAMTMEPTPGTDVPDVPTSSDTSMPSSFIDPKCSAHPECLAEMLADDCCPTIQNVFLDCCDLVDFPTSPPTPGTATAGPTTATPVDTSAPSAADSVAPSGGAEPTAPIAAPTPGASTPSPVAAPSVVTLTPKNYNGCIKVNGNGNDDDDFILATCNTSDEKQQFKFVGDQIQLVMDPSKCLQGGRNPMPSDGKYLRVYTCDSSNDLQMFAWDAPDGALALKEFEDLVVVFRGTTANVNVDPIILGELSNPDVAAREDWIIMT